MDPVGSDSRMLQKKRPRTRWETLCKEDAGRPQYEGRNVSEAQSSTLCEESWRVQRHRDISPGTLPRMTSENLVNPQTPRPFSRWAALLGALAILLVAAGGVGLLLSGAGPLPVDSWWHAHVSSPTGSVLHAIAVFQAVVGGSLGAAACFAIAVATLLALRRWRDALAVALAGILGTACSEFLKGLVQRPRPTEQLYASHGYSYPSGHSMAAAALAVSLTLVAWGNRDLDVRLARVSAVLAGVWVLAMMWSRTALHVHWLSDTIAGALLGLGVALLTRSLCVPMKPRRSHPA